MVINRSMDCTPGGDDTMSPFWKSIRGTSGPRNSPARMLAKGRRNAAIVAALTLVTLTTAGGCSVVHNGYSAVSKNGSWNDTVMVLRNRSHSAKSWHRRKQNFCNEKHTSDYRNGFRAGYEAMCSGSDGCTPPYPPSEYWSWEYQSGEGQARTSAWFAGYPQGVRAAEEEGTANWHQIQLSAGMQSQLQQTGVMTHQGAVYPIPDTSGHAYGQPNMPIPNMSGEPIPAPAAEYFGPVPGHSSDLPVSGLVPPLPQRQ